MTKKQNGSFEQQMQRLQEIVQELEHTDIPLERNVALYKEGRELVRSCKELLERAQHEIRLSAEEGGDDVPFAPVRDDDAARM